MEKQTGSTRTRKEAKTQSKQAEKSYRASEKRKVAEGENYDPEDDLELQYAYQASKADYEEEQAGKGRATGGGRGRDEY
jgi:FKBP-type peptidyl-prolyl cis-trans isomerase